MSADHVAIIVVLLSLVIGVFNLVRMSLQHIRFQRMARLQAETVGKILDKLGSSPDTLEWLRSGDMKRFFDLQIDKSSPYARVLNAAQAGIILGALGSGFIAAGAQEGERGLYAAGLVLVCLGGGFLLAAAASWLLSRQWGLFEQRRSE